MYTVLASDYFFLCSGLKGYHLHKVIVFKLVVRCSFSIFMRILHFAFMDFIL